MHCKMNYPDVLLIFRKSHPNANFSIEASFAAMLAEFSRVSGYTPAILEAPRRSKGLWPRIQTALDVRHHRRHINHITGDVHFVTLALPRKGTILTVHDCGFMNHPKPLMRWLLWFFWLKLPMYRSEVVTAVSEATKQDLIKYTGCSPDKIRVIPTVIKTHFKADPRPFSTVGVRILHIGTAPNKNLLRHIEALEGINCTLNIIGKLSDEVLEKLAKHRISFINEWNLSDDEVQAAYHECDMLLFASTLEGFGMPILEAQTVGRPVVTSNISSMPEVAGSAACLVDPYSVESIRAGVLRVIEDAEYRANLISAGFENTQRFKAETVARAYAELYAELTDHTWAMAPQLAKNA